MDISPGVIIEQKYRIEEKIGEGSSSLVFKALDLDLNKIVALKFLREELAVLPSRRKRFLRESRIAARFIHPAILPVRAIGEWKNTLYLVIDFHSGKTLRTLLRERTITLEEVASLSRQMLLCLIEAHKIGLVHGDIKPANLMIKEESDGLKLSIVDFGLASSADDPTSSQKASGTPNYMAPEVLLGDVPTPASDLYSAALCIYEMITKTLPFLRSGNEHTPLYTIFHQDPTPLSHYRRVPKMVDKIMQKALAISVSERYQSSQEFLDAMELAWHSRYNFSSHQKASLIFIAIGCLIGGYLFFHYHNISQQNQHIQNIERLLSEKKFNEARQLISIYSPQTKEFLWQSIWEEFLQLLEQPPAKMEAFFRDSIWQKEEFFVLHQYLKSYYIQYLITKNYNQQQYQKAIDYCHSFNGTPAQNILLRNIQRILEYYIKQKTSDSSTPPN